MSALDRSVFDVRLFQGKREPLRDFMPMPLDESEFQVAGLGRATISVAGQRITELEN